MGSIGITEWANEILGAEIYCGPKEDQNVDNPPYDAQFHGRKNRGYSRSTFGRAYCMNPARLGRHSATSQADWAQH